MSTPAHTQIITEHWEARVLEPGIIENVIREGVMIDGNEVWKLKKMNLELSEGKPYVVLLSAHYLSEVTKEARETVASMEYIQNTKALAIIAESTGHRIVGNFFLKINKPKIKTELFTTKSKALKWLRKQL